MRVADRTTGPDRPNDKGADRGGEEGEWLEAVRKFWDWGREGHQAALLRGVSEVAAVLKDPNESPPLKLKTTKVCSSNPVLAVSDASG